MDEKALYGIAEKLKDKTPAYVFDLDILKKRMRLLQDKKAGNARLCYAMKANPFLIKALEVDTEYFEVCSPGELEICKKQRICPEKIVFSGVNKRKEEIRAAVRCGVGVVTLESMQQYRYAEECARELGRKIAVMPRLSGGGQFGMEKAELEQIIMECSSAEWLEVAGIHYFTGTQKKKAEKILEEARCLKEYCDDLKERLGFFAKILEFGTGMAVPYFEGDDFDGELLAFERLAAFLETEGKDYEWTLEFGRYIAASCGYYVTEVVDMKRSHGISYCLVDGGIHHLNYYGQNMAMRVPKITHIRKTEDRGNPQEWSVCGSLCTFADVLVRKVAFTGLAVGDILIFHHVGAYSVTEAIYLLLSRNMPAVCFYSREKGLYPVRAGVETYRLNLAEDQR